MTPEGQEAHEGFVRRYHEGNYIKEDVQAVGCMSILLLAYVTILYQIVARIFDLPSSGWVVVIPAVPAILAPRLYFFWRYNRSSLPVKSPDGQVVQGDSKRDWLIVFAIATVANLLLQLLVGVARTTITDW